MSPYNVLSLPAAVNRCTFCDMTRTRRGNLESWIAAEPNPRGYYEAKVWMGTKGNGRPDRRHVQRKSLAAVRREVRRLERLRDTGAAGRPGKAPTVEEMLTRHLTVVLPQKGRAPRTIADYWSKCRNSIFPMWGGQRIDRLTPEHIEDGLAAMLADGAAPATVRKVLAILSSAYEVQAKRSAAVRDDRRDDAGEPVPVRRAARARRGGPQGAHPAGRPAPSSPPPASAASSPAGRSGCRSGSGRARRSGCGGGSSTSTSPRARRARCASGRSSSGSPGSTAATTRTAAGPGTTRRGRARRSARGTPGPARRRARTTARTTPGTARGGSCPAASVRLSGALVLRERVKEKKRKTVPVPAAVCEALRGHRSAQFEQRMLAACEWADHDLVFTQWNGAPGRSAPGLAGMGRDPRGGGHPARRGPRRAAHRADDRHRRGDRDHGGAAAARPRQRQDYGRLRPLVLARRPGRGEGDRPGPVRGGRMTATVPTNGPTGANWKRLQASDLGAASRNRTGGLRITSSSYLAFSGFQQLFHEPLPGKIQATGSRWRLLQLSPELSPRPAHGQCVVRTCNPSRSVAR